MKINSLNMKSKSTTKFDMLLKRFLSLFYFVGNINVSRTYFFILLICKLSQKNVWLILIKWVNPLSANPAKWSNTLKQFVGNRRMEATYTHRNVKQLLILFSTTTPYIVWDGIVSRGVHPYLPRQPPLFWHAFF